MRRFLLISIIALFATGIVSQLGCDESHEDDETTEELEAEEEAVEADEVEEAEPIPTEIQPGNWLGKRLTEVDDLPDICPEEWREYVDFRGYLHWGCRVPEEEEIIEVVSDGQTVQLALMVATDERLEQISDCEEAELEIEPDDELDVVGLDCGEFFAMNMGPDQIITTAASQDSFFEIRETGEGGPRFGESLELGDYAYVVDQPRTETALGPSVARTEAGDGAVFIVVDYTIENMTKETQTALTGDFKLRDYQDREFRASSEAETALAQSGDADFVVSELQPGLSREATTAFRVPEDVLEHPITLVIPEKGLAGSGEVEIPFVLYQ